jgi:hypothetical protein
MNDWGTHEWQKGEGCPESCNIGEVLSTQLAQHRTDWSGLTQEIRLLRESLVALLANHAPPGTIPLDSHHEILEAVNESFRSTVRFTIKAFGILLVASIALLRIAPGVLDKLLNMNM